MLIATLAAATVMTASTLLGVSSSEAAAKPCKVVENKIDGVSAYSTCKKGWKHQVILYCARTYNRVYGNVAFDAKRSSARCSDGSANLLHANVWYVRYP